VEGSSYAIEMDAWSTVQDLKQRIANITQIKVRQQRVFCGSRLLRNNHALHDSLTEPPLVVTVKVVDPGADGVLRPSIEILGQPLLNPAQCQDLVMRASSGLAEGLAPQLALDGTGGTYFLRSRKGRKVAVFKPENEEPFALENPRGFAGRQGQVGLRDGILSGEAASREAAAYCLDQSGFFGVPCSVMAEASSASFCHVVTKEHAPKSGSLQQFVEFDETASDVSPSKYSVAMVHRIVILDLHIVNTDRNDQNILVRYDKTGNVASLVPIDHGYSLPDTLNVLDLDWCWLNWSQLRQPLDEETRAHVMALDVDRAIRVLRGEFGIREPCLTVFKVVNLLLIRGVGAGLTLYQIAMMVCRTDSERPSALEEMYAMAESLSHAMLDSARVRGKDIARGARKVVKETQSFARLVAWDATRGTVAAQAAEAETVLEHAASKLLEMSAGSLDGRGPRSLNSEAKQAFFFYYLNKLVIQAVQKECKEDTSRAHTYAADRPARRSFH